MLDSNPAGTVARGLLQYSPAQLSGWLVDRAVGVSLRVGPDVRPIVGAAVSRWRPDRGLLARWGAAAGAVGLSPRWRPDRHGDPMRGSLRLLGQEHERPRDWSPADRSRLWRYHLHYLDVPAAGVAHEGGEAWSRWLTDALADHWSACRPGRGVAWEAYPTASRLLNLLRVWALLHARGDVDPALDELLGRHTRAATALLLARLEWHLGANHLLRELVALSLGLSVWGRAAAAARALRWLRDQVGRQFLAGGGHVERSPSYHLLCVRDLLELCAALGEGSEPALLEAARRGLDFAEAVEHGDGHVPLFNDSQVDVGLPREALSAAAGHRPTAWEGARSFPDEGFVALRRGGSRVVFDCGPFGAPRQPAHGHCDLLSFEMSHGVDRLVGNRGTPCYGEGRDRLESRGTAFHSTVQVEGAEQAELWGGFRAGWRGSAELLDVVDGDESCSAVASFDWGRDVGLRHRRRLELGEDGGLRVEDDLRRSRPGQELVGRLHLPWTEGAPRASIETWGGTERRVAQTWFPRVGRELPGDRLELRIDAGAQVRSGVRIEPTAADPRRAP